MAKKAGKNSARAKRTRAKKILEDKPKVSSEDSSHELVYAANSKVGRKKVADSIEESVQNADATLEIKETSEDGLPSDPLRDNFRVSVEDTTQLLRDASREQLKAVLSALSLEERIRLTDVLKEVDEDYYSTLLLGNKSNPSFAKINQWLRVNVGAGSEMSDLEKTNLVKALQFFRDKYETTFVYNKEGQDVPCTLTIGSQSKPNYPKRFRVQEKGRRQGVLTQRNRLPLLQLRKE